MIGCDEAGGGERASVCEEEGGLQRQSGTELRFRSAAIIIPGMVTPQRLGLRFDRFLAGFGPLRCSCPRENNQETVPSWNLESFNFQVSSFNALWSQAKTRVQYRGGEVSFSVPKRCNFKFSSSCSVTSVKFSVLLHLHLQLPVTTTLYWIFRLYG